MANSNETGWAQAVAKLKIEQRYDEAVKLLNEVAKHGNLAAKVQLALLGRHAGITDDQANQIIDEVASIVADDDPETHWQLSRAYELMKGKVPAETKLARSFEHLLLCAEYGNNWMDARAVACFYEYGSAAVRPDLGQALYWYQKALERGGDDALHDVKRLQRKLKE